MKTRIYCFSGTGNPLKAARYIRDGLEEAECMPMLLYLEEDFMDVADCVGFVFPIHNFTLPVPVKQFLKRITMKGDAHLFAVATRGDPLPCFSSCQSDTETTGQGTGWHVVR